MITWMGSFRIAYGIRENPWGFWHERMVAYFLVILTLAPMMFSMMLVVFGNQIEVWLVLQTNQIIGIYILFVFKVVRWMISFVTSWSRRISSLTSRSISATCSGVGGADAA